MSRKYLQTTRSKILFCVGGLIFSGFWIMMNLDISFASLVPSERTLDTLRRQQKEERNKWNTMQQKLAELDRVEASYRELLENAWLEIRDGSADIEIPRRIREAAQLREVVLQNVNAVKRTRINNDLFVLEVDLRAIGTLPTLTAFWNDLAACKPAMNWRKIDLRADMSQQGGGTIYLNGTLRLIGREPTAEDLAAQKKAAEAAAQPAAAPAVKGTAL